MIPRRGDIFSAALGKDARFPQELASIGLSARSWLDDATQAASIETMDGFFFQTQKDPFQPGVLRVRTPLQSSVDVVKELRNAGPTVDVMGEEVQGSLVSFAGMVGRGSVARAVPWIDLAIAIADLEAPSETRAREAVLAGVTIVAPVIGVALKAIFYLYVWLKTLQQKGLVQNLPPDVLDDDWPMH